MYAIRHKSSLTERGELCGAKYRTTIKNLRHGARRALEAAPLG
jgi:hypothetical protein